LRDFGAASVPEILRGTPGEPSEGAGKKRSGQEEIKVPGVEGSTEQAARERLADAGLKVEVRRQESPEEDSGRVLEQSVPGGKEADEDSKILLTVGETPEVEKVPDLVGLSYTEAENNLEKANLLLGGVEEAPSETVPAGVIMEQNLPPGTTLDTGAYVYLTTSVGRPDAASAGGGQESGAIGSQPAPSGEASSEAAAVAVVGPPEAANAGGRQESGVTGSQPAPSGVTSSQPVPSGEEEAPSEADAVAAAVQGHYQAIGAANFEEAYSYFGPTFRSQHAEASWIAGEQSYEIQSSTIHSLTVDEVLGTTATATVDVSFVDNTGTPRFVIVWSLLKEDGQWKLDKQISSQRVMASQPDSSPAPTATSSASPSASPTPSDALRLIVC